MDAPEIVYNEDIYIPTSDNEESLTEGFYELQPVLIQANVPTENGANLQNDNNHIDHGNVEYHIQNESRSSGPHNADTVDHDNIELDIQNEPMPSSTDLEVPNMPASSDMEVPNIPASPEMEVPDIDSSSNNDNEEENSRSKSSTINFNFANHWVWEIQDTGTSFAPFTGTPGLFLDPLDTKPVDFFNLLFENQMYKLIACETNKYAESKMQGKFSILHKFISVHLKSTRPYTCTHSFHQCAS